MARHRLRIAYYILRDATTYDAHRLGTTTSAKLDSARAKHVMHYESNPTAIGIFLFFVAFVLGLSFWLGRRAKSA